MKNSLKICKKKKVNERIVLSEIHLRTTGRHLSMGSHSVICHPTEVTAPLFSCFDVTHERQNVTDRRTDGRTGTVP